MRTIFTADWQADFDSLGLCERAANELRCLVDAHLPDAVVFAGDLKHAYNPVDVRVTNFWMEFISSLTPYTAVVVVLGNHDRVGMYADAQNWLPSLAKAGAKVYDKPAFLKFPSGQLAILPYTTSAAKFRARASKLATKANPKTTILVFHAELRGCSYNVLSKAHDARFRPSDLHPEKYRHCIGGHIHLHQKIEPNIHYTGSPFATDWGEANQRKGYILVDTGTDTLTFVTSEIPYWYDPSWPGFKEAAKKVDTWRGARVRIHAPIPQGADFGEVLKKARQEAAAKYPGAMLHVIPEFESKEIQLKIKPSASDDDKIKVYVDETCPHDLCDAKYGNSGVASYLRYYLYKASSREFRSTGAVRLRQFQAQNVLSFKDVALTLEKQGLVLVTGRNDDWHGRSNGAGKTSLIEMIPIAWFGTTFKGQKHDGWARRGSKGPALVGLEIIDCHGRRLYIERGRRPPKLRLRMDGKDVSTGIGSSGTQALIEKLTGMTWQALANAVYIDQSESVFLTGRPSERKAILERFQNLERFAAAQVLVKNRRNILQEQLDSARVSAKVWAGKAGALRGLKSTGQDATKALAIAEKRRDGVLASLAVLGKDEKADKTLEKGVAKIKHEFEKHKLVLDSLVFRSNVLEDNLERTSSVGSGECPTCTQEVDKALLKKHRVQWKTELKAANLLLHEADVKAQSISKRFEEAMAQLESRRRLRSVALAQLKLCTAEVERTATAAWREIEAHKKLEARVNRWEKLASSARVRAYNLKREIALVNYAVEAFSRNGIPAFLNQQLCPALNRAAEYYSELFTQKEIQVRFQVVGGDFDLSIINAHGGSEVGDQSAGEKRLAALITSFALREVVSPCNVLVLDEPGAGLDASNARAFARGVRALKNRFETVLITTHNPHILAELSGEKLIEVVKKNGMSSICEQE